MQTSYFNTDLSAGVLNGLSKAFNYYLLRKNFEDNVP